MSMLLHIGLEMVMDLVIIEEDLYLVEVITIIEEEEVMVGLVVEKLSTL